MLRRICATIITLLLALPAVADDAQRFGAHDTLSVDVGQADDDAANVLQRIVWQPAEFTVRAEATRSEAYDARITFPSPPVEGLNGKSTVTMRWYAARKPNGEPAKAPAVLVVHTLHPDMVIGTAIARSFAQQGLHAFLIELPGYGARRQPGKVPGLVAMRAPRRTIVEVRRARDAIAALPNVDKKRIALHGTSMGGFVAAVSASMDDAFDPVVLMLTGADMFGVLENGRADAARLRQHADAAGYTEDQMRRTLDRVDPQYVAHRLAPQRTWLFTARQDQVVPRQSSMLLAETIGLPKPRHVMIAGDHYTSMLTLPGLVQRMARIIKGESVEAK